MANDHQVCSPHVPWIDAHCHLPFDGEIPQELNRAVDAGIVHMINVGCDAPTSRAAIELARIAGGRVSATVGLHPHDATQGLKEIESILHESIDNCDSAIVGIGECGLDYFYEHSPRNVQREIFAHQICLAKEYNLPLIIHSRDSWDDTFAILQSEGAPTRTVLHCFTGGIGEAEIALEQGLYLSFSGVITFSKSMKVQEAARICPIKRMMIETDSPYLSPVPFRGKPNEPKNVGVIGEFIANLKEVELREFSRQILQTTSEFFQLKSLEI